MRQYIPVLLLLGGCRAPAATITAGPGEIVERIAARAIVEPVAGVADVVAPRSGRLAAVEVEVGERVEAGAVLARYDEDSGGLDAVIDSPIAGVVLAVAVSPGDDVSHALGALFSVGDPEHVALRVELEDSDAARARTGLALTASAHGEVVATGVLGAPRPAMELRRIEPDGALVRVAVAPVEAGPALPIGRVLDVVLVLPPRPVELSLPREAITLQDGRTVVHLEGGTHREVVLGVVGETHVEIVSGLEAGASVEVL